MPLYVIFYALITLQKIQKMLNSNFIVLKCILFTLRTIRVRYCTYSIGKYITFNCKSLSSPHSDCLQSITVEKNGRISGTQNI